MLLIGGNMNEKLIDNQEVIGAMVRDPIRIRINVSTSTKGVKTYDCTVEVNDYVMNIEEIANLVLEQSDELVAKLDERYPAGGALE
jgi:hypothetical protein